MSIDPVTLKCLKYIQTACLGSDVFVHTGAMSLFFSAQQLSPKHIGCLTRRAQYFTYAAAA